MNFSSSFSCRNRVMVSFLVGVVPILPWVVCYACILVKVRQIRREFHKFLDEGATIPEHLAARHLKQASSAPCPETLQTLPGDYRTNSVDF